MWIGQRMAPKTQPLIVLLLISCTLVICATGNDSRRRAIVQELKQSTNQFKRQLDRQVGNYQDFVKANTRREIKESIFAFSEVFHECQDLLRVLQQQVNAADPGCVQQAPYQMAQIAAEASVDFTQCFGEMEASLRTVVSSVEGKLNGKAAESEELSTHVQRRVFGRVDTTEDELNAIKAAIWKNQVAWDNVESINIYKEARELPGRLFDVGSNGFICGMSVRNSVFRKLKDTEEYLNTNCR